MNNAVFFRRSGLMGKLLGLGAAMMAASGCHHGVNPFVDPYSSAVPITTASSIGAFEAAKESQAAVRSFSEERLAMADGSVTHAPLYFEDWLGDMTTDDGHFAWTGADFLSVLTWQARFLLNIGLFPISAIDTPPWCEMVSDGRPSRRVLWKEHDARKVDDMPPCCAGHAEQRTKVEG